MFRALSVSLLFSITAQASHLDMVCKQAMNGIPVFAEGVVARRTVTENGNRFVIESLEGKKIFEHTVTLRSVVSYQGNFWVLTTNELMEISGDGSILARFEMDKNLNMSLAGNVLLIVRGGGTLTAFDLTERKMTWTSYMNEIPDGNVISGSFDGTNLLAVMTSNREGGFNGIATVSLIDGSVIRKTPYDQGRAGVIDPDAKSRWHNDQLILNNGGWIHVITKAQLASTKAIKPKWIAHAIGSGMDQHYMMLRGEFFFEGNNLVGCGAYNERQDGEYIRKTGLFKISLIK